MVCVLKIKKEKPHSTTISKYYSVTAGVLFSLGKVWILALKRLLK